MTGRQKIFKILKDIKNESEINPNTTLMSFKFNTHVVGSGILNNDEEKRILMKLEKMGVIKTHSPNDEWRKFNQFAPIESIAEKGCVFIEILPAFYLKYFWYKLTSFDNNAWNIVNPFWWSWKIFRGSIFLIEWLWNKSKVITIIIGTVGGLIVYDWSLAWTNIKIILEIFGIYEK